MCASRAQGLGMDYWLTVPCRSNTYECQMRLSTRSRISSRVSLRRGVGGVVCKGVIVEEEVTEDMARGAGVVGAEGEVDEREARKSHNYKDKTLMPERGQLRVRAKRRICSRELGGDGF